MAILHGGAMATLQDLPEKYVAHMDRPAPATPANEERSVPPEVYLLQQGGRIDFNALVEEFEARLILQALEVTGGNKKEAALLLSLNRTTLLEKIKKKQLEFIM